MTQQFSRIRASRENLWFIGMDPALKTDYFGIAVHGIPIKPEAGKLWLPRLALVTKLKAENYIEMSKAISSGILRHFSAFTKITIDYTNNQPIGDALEYMFGEYRVDKIKFTPGPAGSKMQLMQNAMEALNSGYKFPDHTKMKNLKMAENVRGLKEQLVNERIKLNPNGTIKFEHKGPHNDMLHAWALSLSAAMDWLRVRQNPGQGHVGGPLRPKDPSPYKGLHEDDDMSDEDIVEMMSSA